MHCGRITAKPMSPRISGGCCKVRASLLRIVIAIACRIRIRFAACRLCMAPCVMRCVSSHNTLDIEINSVTDNPIIFADDGSLMSGGNFHGEPVGLAMDYAQIALTEHRLHRRAAHYKLLYGAEGLPPFLTERFGLRSGYMLAQYTAAALVSENKTLSAPASVDSIPTSAGQEDHDSMGTISARQCYPVVANYETSSRLSCSLQRKRLISANRSHLVEAPAARIACPRARAAPEHRS